LQQSSATLKDVAREAGVNVSTASRALAGGYGVHRTTRERVIVAAEKLNYRPNPNARSLVTGRSDTIGLLISDIRNPFFAEVARGVEDGADAAGVQVFFCNSDMDAGKQMRYFQALRTRQVDGIIMNSVSNLSASQQSELADAGVTVVLLNRPSDPDPRFSTVSADNFQGGFIAGEYLIRLGHREIGHITGPRGHGNLSQRAKGFLKACEAASVTPVVLYGEHTFQGGFELTTKMILRHPSMTALFAANDIMAFGAFRAAADAGLSVPCDLSIIGFDDIEMASVIAPSLTTIKQPKREIGEAAVQILLSKSSVPEQRLFGVTLIERQSCRALDISAPPSSRAAAASSNSTD
jgi:DNA-binding LacI/PurR family transcriptional regulator